LSRREELLAGEQIYIETGIDQERYGSFWKEGNRRNWRVGFQRSGQAKPKGSTGGKERGRRPKGVAALRVVKEGKGAWAENTPTVRLTMRYPDVEIGR
jgi:hypothetical protein